MRERDSWDRGGVYKAEEEERREKTPPNQMPIIFVVTVHYVHISLCVCVGGGVAQTKNNSQQQQICWAWWEVSETIFFGQELPFLNHSSARNVRKREGGEGCHQGISSVLKKSHLLHTNCLRDRDWKKIVNYSSWPISGSLLWCQQVGSFFPPNLSRQTRCYTFLQPSATLSSRQHVNNLFIDIGLVPSILFIDINTCVFRISITVCTWYLSMYI